MTRLMAVSALLFFMLLCDTNPTEQEECSRLSDPDKGIELIFPRGGEIFTVGNSVDIRWKVDAAMIVQVTVEVSINGIDGPWRNIHRAIDVPQGNDIICMDTVWTIGEEYETIEYAASQTVLLKVSDYLDKSSHKDVSSMITVDR
ncbi:MAG: hypothetical protein JW913_10725 [Chitinispirillaceae bacterium]|nr:hypothetical protein [Chitinispirillaceae bacterium]